MTDDRAERALRAMFSAHAEQAPQPIGLWSAVSRRDRRHRAALVGVTAGAAAIAVAVPAVALSDRAPTVPAAAAPTTSSSPARLDPGRCYGSSASTAPAAGLRAPGRVPGSMGGDPTAVTAVLRAAWNSLLVRTPVPGGRLDPATAHVRMVQRADDGLIVGVVGATRTDGRYGWDVFVAGPDVKHLYVDNAGTGYLGQGGTALPQRGAFLNQTYQCGVTEIVVVAPPGSTGTATWVSDIGADGVVHGGAQPVPLRPDGVAVFPPPVPGQAVRVRLAHDGKEVGNLVLGDGHTSPSSPERNGLLAAVQAAPGDADPASALRALETQWHQIMYPQQDLRVLWRGTLGDRTVAVAATTLPSGAVYVWGNAASAGRFSPVDGVLPAGGLDRTALRFRPQGVGDTEVVVFTGTRQVTVDGQRRSVAGGLTVPAGARVTVDGLDLVDVDDLSQLPGPRG